jgi:hypothetical protein
VKIKKPALKDAVEWVGFVLVAAGLACLGVFLGGALLGAALGLTVAGGVLVLAGNV